MVQVTKKNIIVTNVKNSTVTLNGFIYYLHCTIYRHGPNAYSGNHTSLHKINDSWILADDMDVKSVRWPENSTGLCMLFYQHHSDA